MDVVSNPFFSSLNLLRDAPLSKLERKYYHKPSFSQNVSSIFVFPAQFQNAKDKVGTCMNRNMEHILECCSSLILNFL